MNKFVEIVIGLVLLTLPIYLWVTGQPAGWELGEAALILLKGGIVWGFIGVGLLFLVLGISDLRE